MNRAAARSFLQAAYEGVNYNKLMTPKFPRQMWNWMSLRQQNRPLSRRCQQMMVIEPNASQIAVTETVIVQNDSNTTYNNDANRRLALLFAARGEWPSARERARVRRECRCRAPPKERNETDIFKVDFPSSRARRSLKSIT